jgi:hypothetical protein
VVAATAAAALATAGRESQHREHPGGSPLDVIKAALDGAAAHVAAAGAQADGAAEAPDAEAPGTDAGLRIGRAPTYRAGQFRARHRYFL